MNYAKLDIAEQWGRMNDSIVALVDYIPREKINWSPREDLWNFRGLLYHIASVRHSRLAEGVKDGEPRDDAALLQLTQSRGGVLQALNESWARVARFLSNQEQLDGTYDRDNDGRIVSGHWIAFHLLEHDIHHRSDIFHYLALLEIEHPEVGTP